MKSIKRTILLSLVILTASCQKQGVPVSVGGEGDYIRMGAAFELVPTKAVPLTEMPSSFRLWGATYTGSVPGQSAYMNNELMSWDGFSYVSAYRHPEVPSSEKLFYWSVIGEAGVTLPSATASGWPSIAYSTPTVPANQKDILVGTAGPFNGTQTSTTIVYDHILCGVSFSHSDSDDFAGKIVSATFRNVYLDASFVLGGTGWASYSNKGSIALTINADSAAGCAGTPITSVQDPLLLIPQSFPDDAALDMVVTDASGTKTLTLSLKGQSIAAGKINTFKVNLTAGGSLVVEDTELTPWVYRDEDKVEL